LARNQRQAHPQTTCGFTLVEILIIISVIALLAALLFPVIANVREQARITTCASNLRQTGLAIQQYAIDHRGFYPTINPPRPNCTWVDKLAPYVKSPRVFECPSFPDAIYVPGCPPRGTVTGPVIGGYAMNDLRAGQPNVHASRFKQPSRTIVVLDGSGMGTGFVNPGRDPITSVEDLLQRDVVVRHNGGDNVLMADGHVKWLRLEAMTDQSLWRGRN
jgi:prepilin-type processing-associated H-X9-DG protein